VPQDAAGAREPRAARLSERRAVGSQIAKVAWALSESQRRVHPALVEALEARAAAVAPQVDTRGIGMLLSGLCKLRAVAKPGRPLAPELVAACEAAAPELGPREITLSLWGLGALPAAVVPSGFVDGLAARASALAPGLNAHELCQAVWKLAQLGAAPQEQVGPWSAAVDQPLINRWAVSVGWWPMAVGSVLAPRAVPPQRTHPVLRPSRARPPPPERARARAHRWSARWTPTSCTSRRSCSPRTFAGSCRNTPSLNPGPLPPESGGAAAGLRAASNP